LAKVLPQTECKTQHTQTLPRALKQGYPQHFQTLAISKKQTPNRTYKQWKTSSQTNQKNQD
jgi:hypothetical protein